MQSKKTSKIIFSHLFRGVDKALMSITVSSQLLSTSACLFVFAVENECEALFFFKLP